MANIQLAKNLLYLRTLYNLKQDDIANLFNITRQACSNYEKSTRLFIRIKKAGNNFTLFIRGRTECKNKVQFFFCEIDIVTGIFFDTLHIWSF